MHECYDCTGYCIYKRIKLAKIMAVRSRYRMSRILYFICFCVAYQAHKWENYYHIQKDCWGYNRNLSAMQYATTKELISILVQTVRYYDVCMCLCVLWCVCVCAYACMHASTVHMYVPLQQVRIEMELWVSTPSPVRHGTASCGLLVLLQDNFLY